MEERKTNMVRVPCHPTLLQQILGGVVVLAAHSNLHSQYRINTLFSRVGPSLLKQQFYYAEKSNKQDGTSAPIQFMSWIMINEEYMHKFRSGRWEYRGEEIPEGPYVLILEVLSPFVPPSGMVRRALHEVLSTKEVKGVMFSRVREGSTARIMYYDAKPRPFQKKTSTSTVSSPTKAVPTIKPAPATSIKETSAKPKKTTTTTKKINASSEPSQTPKPKKTN